MKIGFLSMPLTGHLHPMTALGRKMQARGHEVTFFGLPDAARIVHSAGLDFVPFGEEVYPSGPRLQCMRIWQCARDRMSSATPSRRCIRNGPGSRGRCARTSISISRRIRSDGLGEAPGH
jgi:hypothetical protein